MMMDEQVSRFPESDVARRWLDRFKERADFTCHKSLYDGHQRNQNRQCFILDFT